MKVVKDLLLTSGEAGMRSSEGSSPILTEVSGKNPLDMGIKSVL